MWRRKGKLGGCWGGGVVVWCGGSVEYPVLSWRLSVARVTATKHRQKANSTAASFIFFF